MQDRQEQLRSRPTWQAVVPISSWTMCARAAGGLKIIGTERHESRRIDNQLRGRSGRQGDPGESQFYISLEDDLMRLFGSERLMGVFNALGVPEMSRSSIRCFPLPSRKHRRRSSNNFGIRKNLLEYDQVTTSRERLSTKSAAGFWTVRACVMRSIR